MQIEAGKKYKTRDGRTARITDKREGSHDFPFRGKVANPVDRHGIETWTVDGSWNGRDEAELDLVADA